MRHSITTHDRQSAGALVAAAAATLLLVAGCGAGEPANDGTDDDAAERDAAASTLATARILEPAEGEEIAGSVRVVLGADNVEIVPAGDARPNSGHHHLFLNADPVAEGEAIPADVDGIVHLGQAQSEHVFEDLAPGEYTLIAVIGDLVHRVIPQNADTVRFRVVEPASD